MCNCNECEYRETCSKSKYFPGKKMNLEMVMKMELSGNIFHNDTMFRFKVPHEVKIHVLQEEDADNEIWKIVDKYLELEISGSNVIKALDNYYDYIIANNKLFSETKDISTLSNHTLYLHNKLNSIIEFMVGGI